MEDLRSTTSADNGAKSQGPVTAEGKARSARNAEKHGIYAHHIVLRSESTPAYEDLCTRYYQHFAPQSPLEADLVDQLIAATWKLRRFSSLETAALDHALATSTESVKQTYSTVDEETRAYLAYDQLAQANGTFASLTRAQAAQVRQFDRALRLLRAFQKSRNEPTFIPNQD